jgi:hypothetical protein
MRAETRRWRPRSVCDDRSRHPCCRTVRENRRPAEAIPADRAAEARCWHCAAAQRCRTGYPGGAAGPARLHLRGPLDSACGLDSPCGRAPAAPAPVPRTCRGRAGTAGDCGPPTGCSGTALRSWPPAAAAGGPTTSGWWTPLRSRAPAPARPSSTPSWADGRSTGCRAVKNQSPIKMPGVLLIGTGITVVSGSTKTRMRAPFGSVLPGSGLSL